MVNNLFTEDNQYDGQGNLLTNNVTAMENGTLTINGYGNHTGNLPACYSSINNTQPYYFVFQMPNGDNVECMTWDFLGKKTFRNIYATCYFNDGIVYLKGSNDGSTWTTLATSTTATGTDIYDTLVATDVKYRYIAIFANKESGTYMDAALIAIKAVMK